MRKFKEQLRQLISSVFTSPVFPWALLFVAAGLMFPQRGGDNTGARLATMRSITEAHTLTMDKYLDWSDDWSLSPNGHYYSDKAPGSALLGLPVFAITDLPTLALTEATDTGRHPAPHNPSYLFLVFWMQLLPFALLICLIANDLTEEGAPALAVQFFAVAALFGNTAAIYMFPYSGHALAAWLFLASFYSWRKDSMYWAGLFLGGAVLTDYATIMTLPFFFLATLLRFKKARPFAQALVGTLPMLALWCWYHTVTFGSPVAMAAGYANPANQIYDPNNHHTGPRSLFALVPYPIAIFKLLFGPERGLLFTQAWILALLPSIAWTRKFRMEFLLAVGAYAGVFFLNSSVLVWAAGRAAGPRYCCLVFPALAYLAALTWMESPLAVRVIFVLGLAEALVLRLAILPFNERAPAVNLWDYYSQLFAKSLADGSAMTVVTKIVFFSFSIFGRAVLCEQAISS